MWFYILLAFEFIFEFILLVIYLFYLISFQVFEALANYNNLNYFKDKFNKLKITYEHINLTLYNNLTMIINQ
jgi:hypothetical protein